MKRSRLLLNLLILALAGAVCAYVLTIKTPDSSDSSTLTHMWLPASELPREYDILNTPTWYWSDGEKIYCLGGTIQEEVKGVDIESFEFSSFNRYGRDKNHVYNCSDVLLGVDPATFEVLDATYAKDATQVFAQGVRIEDADASTFTLIPGSEYQGPYGKDAKHVYWLEQPLPKADPDTFVVDENGVHDKNWIYHQSNELFGPMALITENRQYAASLPSECTKVSDDRDPILPSTYPDIFSDNLQVIGYVSADAACIIDKTANTVQYFEYGWEDGVELSKDGSKLYFMKYMSESMAVNDIPCPTCGQYSIDRKTGVIEKN